MCALLKGLNPGDGSSISRSEFRVHMKRLDRKLERLAARIKASKADSER
jgi:hypothetical protein